MTPAQPSDAKSEAIEALRLRVCVCGGPKQLGFSFCGVCYHMLPRVKQLALWRPAGKGYEEAYADAKAWVEAKWRRPL